MRKARNLHPLQVPETVGIPKDPDRRVLKLGKHQHREYTARRLVRAYLLVAHQCSQKHQPDKRLSRTHIQHTFLRSPRLALESPLREIHRD